MRDAVRRCARASDARAPRRARASRARARASRANPFGDAGAAKTRVDPFASSAPRTREATRAREAENVADAREAYGAWDDVEVFEVPATLRRDGAARNERFVEHVALEGLFGRALADAFHDSASFRTDVRRAMRRDLFAPDENLSAEANAAMSALSSSVHVNWFESRTGYAALSALFESRGIEGVTGERFIRTLGGLCGEPCHGTLIDIASPVGARRIRHSWHQDSGLDRLTVMLGFPASTPSESVGLPTGVGVFSHAVRLSHALRHPSAPGAGAVLRWEDVASDADVEIDARLVARPAFARDREIIVYRDSSHLHSAPDVAHREAVWRFM